MGVTVTATPLPLNLSTLSSCAAPMKVIDESQALPPGVLPLFGRQLVVTAGTVPAYGRNLRELPSGQKEIVVMPTTEALGPETIVEQLRALRVHVPEYVQLSVANAQSLRRAAHVDPDFVQAS